MGWSIGFDEKHKRDIGYGVPAKCDHPACDEEIDRGLSHVCGGDPFGGEHGCGLHFCRSHLRHAGDKRDGAPLCNRCFRNMPIFTPKADVPDWIQHKLTDPSWERWRAENPDAVAELRKGAQCRRRDAGAARSLS